MILEQVQKWKMEKGLFGCEIDESYFYVFFMEIFQKKPLLKHLADFAYEIYQIQVCLEGIIEDLDYGQEDQETEEDIGQRNECPCQRRCA